MPLSSYIIYTLAAMLFSFIVCYKAIPSILQIAWEKKLFDEPNRRSSHSETTPSFGGVAIFMGFVLSMLLFSNDYFQDELKYIVAATFIMFSLGIKDDILALSARKKMLGQLIAAAIVVVLGGIRITNLHGFLGVGEVNEAVSILISLFSVIVITNGFNLIDGIDGLASGINGLCVLTFGTWFFMTEQYGYAIMAASVFGSLVAFFRYNVYGKDMKIFMGDTGSLVLGLILSIIVFHFNESNIDQNRAFAIHAAPAISSAVLIVPFFDTLRVMLIRILKGKNPFKPDRNHIHHKLLSLGLSHRASTFYIMFANLIIILIAFFLQSITFISDEGSVEKLNINLLLFIIIGLGALSSWIPTLLLKRRERK